MSSLYLNGKSWYIKSLGKCSPTGYTTTTVGQEKTLLDSKAKVKREILALPDSHKLKLQFFDIQPEKSEVKSERVKVDFAVEQYAATVNGLGPDGQVVDERRHENFSRVDTSNHKRIKAHFGQQFLDEVSDSDILKWIQSMRAEGMKPESIKRIVYAFSSIFTHGVSKYRGWCKFNPITDKDGVVQNEFRKNKGVWTYQGRIVEVTQEMILKMLEASKQVTKIRRRSSKNPNWFYFLMLLNFVLGARRRELLTIQRKHVNLEKARVNVETRNAKTRKERWMFYGFHPELSELFLEFSTGLGSEDFIFAPNKSVPYGDTAVRKKFEQAKKLAGLPQHLTFRDFRHASAMLMEARGVTPRAIAMQLGTSVKLLETTYLKRGQDFFEAELMQKMA